MTKKEIKTAQNSELICEYILTYASFASNFVLQRGIKALERHLADLDAEMLARGILTQEQINRLNM